MVKQIGFLILVINFFLAGGLGFSQDSLVGVWQRDTNLISAGMNDTYHFYNDGTFILVFNEYNYIKSIQSISGKFVVNEKEICFELLTCSQIVGEIKPGSAGFQDTWIFEGKEVRTIEQHSGPYCFEFSKSEASGAFILLIDRKKFFKVSDNPDSYFNNRK